MLALVGPIFSKIKLFGAHLGPTYVELMLAYVGVCWPPMLAQCWPMLSHLGGYVGDMLVILGLC